MGLLGEIKKGKAIAQGIIKGVKEKRLMFYNKLDQVNFKNSPLKVSEKMVSEKFTELRERVIKQCDLLSSVCKGQIKDDGKSKSDPYLHSIVETSDNLKDILKLALWANITPALLQAVHKHFKELQTQCLKVSKASFPATFKAVLDYTPTRKKLSGLSNQLSNTEKVFADGVAEVGIEDFLSKFEGIEGDAKGFFQKNQKIATTLYFPTTVGKYEQLKYDLNFNLYDTVKGKLNYLYGILQSLFKFIKKKEYFLNNEKIFELFKKLRRLIDSSTEKEADEYENCPICFTEMDVLADKITVLPCNHTFHRECLRDWFEKQIKKKVHPSCPTCKRNYDEKFVEKLLKKK